MDKNEVVEILKELPERIAAVIMPSDRFFDYKGALSYAISHLEAERWIPITERAPKEYGNYFVTIEYVDERIITITKYSQHGWFLEGVTAWRELPKPYESEDK